MKNMAMGPALGDITNTIIIQLPTIIPYYTLVVQTFVPALPTMQ